MLGEAMGILASEAMSPLALRHAELLVPAAAPELRATKAARLLALSHADLLMAIGTRLLTGKAAHLWCSHLRSRKSLTTAATVAATTAAHEGRRSAAARTTAPATAVWLTASAAAASAAAVRLTASAAVLIVAARPCHCRGRDRQRGNARSEKHPGQHGKSPFEREKRSVRCTVPSGKRTEPAGYRTSLNLKCRVYSDS